MRLLKCLYQVLISELMPELKSELMSAHLKDMSDDWFVYTNYVCSYTGAISLLRLIHLFIRYSFKELFHDEI